MAVRHRATALLSLPHTLLFKMKRNTVSVAKWKMLLRSRKHPGWHMVAKSQSTKAEPGMSLILFRFSADFKLSIQTPASVEVRPQPCSATASYKDRLVRGLTSGPLIPTLVQTLPWCKAKSLYLSKAICMTMI